MSNFCRNTNHSGLNYKHTVFITREYAFECDMGLDGILTSHIERVAADMACHQSAIYTHISREWMPYAFSRTEYP